MSVAFCISVQNRIPYLQVWCILKFKENLSIFLSSTVVVVGTSHPFIVVLSSLNIILYTPRHVCDFSRSVGGSDGSGKNGKGGNGGGNGDGDNDAYKSSVPGSAGIISYMFGELKSA